MTSPRRSSSTPATSPFEPEFINGLKRIFEEQIVFNQVIGLKVTDIQKDRASGSILMRPDLIGHFRHHRIHGGVISAGLDAMGGLAVMAAMGARHMQETPEQRLLRFNRLGTIDLRIDYLRQGIGAEFTLEAEVLALGARVARARMAFLSAEGQLLSTGTAAYIVS